jgi:type IV pilus assembly protein PilA
MQKLRGFSIVELLIAVAIILILAAIAIPNLLRSRIAASEAAAVSALREVRTAEIAYSVSYPNIGFADTLANLGGASPCTASPATSCILDQSVAAAIPGSGGRNGYVFQAIGVGSGSLHDDFVAGATPVTWKLSGNRDFCVTSDGVFRGKMGAAGDVPVSTVAACQALAPLR